MKDKTDIQTKKAMVVDVRPIDWAAPKSEDLPGRLTMPVTIEYLDKHGVFEVKNPNSFVWQGGLNKPRLEERLLCLLTGTFEHAIKTIRYFVKDWGDSPFTFRQDGYTLVAV